MKTKATSRVVFLCLAAFTMTHAHAQTVAATLNSVNPSLTVQGTFNGTTYGGHWSGKLNFTQFDAFCGEPGQGIALNETVNYSILAPGSILNYDTLSRIVGGYLGSSQDATNAAAAQWAIWEVVTDGIDSPSFDTGNIRITDGQAVPQGLVEGLALTYVTNALLGTLPQAPITFLHNTDKQDMIAITGFPVVPEPSSALLVGLGVLGLLRRRR